MQKVSEKHYGQDSHGGQGAGRFVYPPHAAMHNDYGYRGGWGHHRPGFFFLPLLFLAFLFLGGWKLIFPLLFIGFIVAPFIFFMRGGMMHRGWGRGGWNRGEFGPGWGKGWGHGQGWHPGRWGWDNDEEKPKRKNDEDDDKPKRDGDTLYV